MKILAILFPLSCKFDLSIFHLQEGGGEGGGGGGGGGGGRAGTGGDGQTLTARGTFSLYLCVTKATPGTAGVSGNSFRASY